MKLEIVQKTLKNKMKIEHKLDLLGLLKINGQEYFKVDDGLNEDIIAKNIFRVLF